jgi:serine/threonine protein kinase
VLGKGAFGKVLLVRDKATRAIYAMKMLHKSVILEREQASNPCHPRSHIIEPYFV